MNKNIHQVCLTPVRNESWIIKEFIAATKLWAERLIVMDQVSTDGTREILQAEEGVDLICNDDPTFDETFRQRTLIDRARASVPEKRILLALDADEFLSANFATSKEWQRIAEASPGTVLRFWWVNVQPDFNHAWIPPQRIAFGFVDNGVIHQTSRIHSPRLPSPEGAPVIDLDEIVILHFQYVSESRMQNKHRWYQAWEHLNFPEKSALDIFRMYNHRLGSWKDHEMHPVKPEWLEGYDRAGIHLKDIKSEEITWWDQEILEMIDKHGVDHFRRMAIWDKDWQALAKEAGRTGGKYADPRNALEKLAHRWLAASQGHREKGWVRVFERILRIAGW